MIALKCKMCGGNIQITGESYGICDSCGCEVTLPKIDDDKRAEFYNRGNYFRQKGDFDRAYSAFEHIIADDMQDAEAHWSLTLCRYGVEYVQDPRSGEYKPTVSRMSFSPVLEDPDYLKALEYSDEYTKGLYRTEARKIAQIQDRYLAISRREEPYDVFICFKAEEDNGQRTQGSIIAQDIYEQLTDKGVKTFFSRITLEGKLGEDYEPYIFAALASAKVMLVVSNNAEHLQARWVKNEWSRFLNMMDKDHTKSIIRVFKNMSPYDFPSELQNSGQGVDASRIGYMQDLTRGILKLLGRNPDKSMVGGPQSAVQITVTNLLKRAQQAIEDGNYEQAISYTEQVLNMDPENGEAYYYRLLATNQVSSSNQLVYISVEWDKDTLFNRALQYANEKRKAELQQVLQLSLKEKLYLASKEAMQKGNYDTAKRGFEKVGQYKDAPALLEECNQYFKHAECLKEYQEEVGDGKSYLARKYKEEHKSEFWEYRKLVGKWATKSNPKIAWGVLIIGIILSFLGYMHMQQLLTATNAMGGSKWVIQLVEAPATCINLLWPILWTLAVSILIWLLIAGITDNYSIIKLIVAAFFIFVIILNIPIPAWLFPLIGVLFLVPGFVMLIKSIGYRKAREKMYAFENEHLKPFEDRKRQEIEKRYGKMLKPEEMVELKSINSGMYDAI